MRTTILPHHFTTREIADLLDQPAVLLQRLVRCKICPPWIWRKRWPEPRWPLSTVPEWLRILDRVDLNSLPLDPPPLERSRGPTVEQLETALRWRLRREGVKRRRAGL